MNQSYNSSLLATAVAATLCLGIGNAAALEVSLYGVGHVSGDSNNDGNDTQGYIASNSSRLGLKGSQVLSDHLNALFQFESGVDLTGRGTNDGNGSGSENNLFTTARDSFVGLGGDNWGKVIGGRLGILNQWLYDYNLFADQVGDLGNIWGGTGLPGRESGVIAYGTPNWGGFDGMVTYEPESGTEDGDTTVVKLNFGTGGFKVGGAYSSVGLGNDPVLKDSRTVGAITGSYSADNFSVGGGWQSESDMGGVPGNDRDSYTVGGSYSFGKNTIKAQYTDSSSDVSSDFDASQIGVGWDYSLFKSTTVYVAYSKTDNNSLANFTANNYGHGQAVTPAPGEDPSSFSIGVVYKFDVGLVK